MMSYRLLKTLTLSSVSICSLACTSISSPPTTSATPIEISEWVTRLPRVRSGVKITFTLPQHARAEFQFFNGKPSHSNYALARVMLSDENCTSGHLGSINYKKSRSEYLIQYFEKEASWSRTNTITLSWNDNSQITTKLNGEVISTDTLSNVTTLKIVSHLAPIKIQTLEYLPL
ncbi:MAG: hypothetical protein U1B30_01910 [Pseudomonadota bacterium]|nr:hypothetical protein [Pseudomonadota bacterium]